MKKVTFILLAVLLCVPVFAKKQQKVTVVKLEPDSSLLDVTAYRVKANHWSLAVNAGLGLLDGDQTQDISVMWPRTDFRLSIGATVEYTINPIWGVYLEYLYNPYSGFTWYRDVNLAYAPSFHETFPMDFKGVNHDASVGVSVNILNLFYKCRPQTWNWYGNVGIGASFFNVHAYSEGTTTELAIPFNPEQDITKGFNGRSLSLPIATTVEYNPTNWLAILLNVQYRVHRQDSYDLAIKGNMNDNTAYAGLGLRWKINSLSHKDRLHVRDMAPCQYEPDMSAVLAKKNAKRLDDLEDRVDTLENRMDDLEPRVKALEDDMDKLRDDDQDGVPNIRDRHPNTPPNTPVNYYGEPITKKDSGNEYGDEFEYPSVYFATAKNDLTSVSHSVLAKVARIMYANPDLKIEIHGYCDEQGVPKYKNQQLSERRAKIVRDTLIKQYGVPANRIVKIEGHGAVSGPTKDFLPNRRTDMVIVK